MSPPGALNTPGTAEQLITRLAYIRRWYQLPRLIVVNLLAGAIWKNKTCKFPPRRLTAHQMCFSVKRCSTVQEPLQRCRRHTYGFYTGSFHTESMNLYSCCGILSFRHSYSPIKGLLHYFDTMRNLNVCIYISGLIETHWRTNQIMKSQIKIPIRYNQVSASRKCISPASLIVFATLIMTVKNRIGSCGTC